MNAINARPSSSSSDSNKFRDEFVSGLFLFLYGVIISFVLSVIPYLGPLFGLMAAFGLGWGCGWIDGFWPSFLGASGVIVGLFAASAFKFGFRELTVTLFVFQLILFFLGFSKGVFQAKRENRRDVSDGDGV